MNLKRKEVGKVNGSLPKKKNRFATQMPPKAALRFFEAEHGNLIENLLNNMDYPPRARNRLVDGRLEEIGRS